MTPGKPSLGFSLVEIAVALGLLAFVLLAIVGLLGVGLDASRSAHVDTMQAAASRLVLSRVISEIRNDTNAGAFDAFTESQPVYFTYDGLEAGSADDRYFECVVKETAGSGIRPEAAANMKILELTVRYPVGAEGAQFTNVMHSSLFRQN